MHENIAQYLARSKSSVNGSFCHFVVIVGMIFGISSFFLLLKAITHCSQEVALWV